jgi:hypothetical protein
MKPFLASFEDYLPLLIFFALWWIAAKKRKAPRQQPPQPPAPSSDHTGERFNLQEILKQILTGKVEMPLPQHHGPQPGPAAEPAARGAADRLSLVDKWESLHGPDEEPLSSTVRPEASLTPIPPVQPAILSPGRRSRQPYAYRTVNRGDLRKAVVWSEILGPPVSLRE